MANNKKTKLFRREYIPLVIAFLVLVLLIVALVFTIMNKPKQEEPKKRTENTLRTEEISVGDLSDECEGYDITKLSEEAKNVSLVYEVIDDYYRGQMYCLSKDVNGDGIVTLDDLCDDIGYALKMKINGLTHNLKVIVTNEETTDLHRDL